MTEDVQYLLDNLLRTDGAPGLLSVVAVTADGLLRSSAHRAGTEAATRAETEKLAAATTGLVSIAHAVQHQLNDSFHQVLIEGGTGYYLVIAAGQNAYLGARTTHDADLEAVTYGLHRIVRAIGDQLDSASRLVPSAVSVAER